jgi:hypothetical protein
MQRTELCDGNLLVAVPYAEALLRNHARRPVGALGDGIGDSGRSFRRRRAAVVAAGCQGKREHDRQS